jgi:predicted transcriptional regulator
LLGDFLPDPLRAYSWHEACCRGLYDGRILAEEEDMTPKTSIRELMSPLKFSVETKCSAEEAGQLMESNGLRFLPVCCEGSLVGSLSRKDINFACVMQKDCDLDLRVRDVYNPNVFSIGSATPIGEVIEPLFQAPYGSAVITDDEKPVGLFTVTDAYAYFPDLFS